MILKAIKEDLRAIFDRDPAATSWVEVVLTYAGFHALLGAMGEGDLGRHYPSSDQRFKDISSLKLLEDVVGKMRGKGYRIVNVDTVIIAQAPRLSSHLAAMQKQMAQVLGVDPDLVNVKVKSGEGIGMIGREEGIAAQAVCLIERPPTA